MPPASKLMDRIQALKLVSQEFPEEPVVFTCGATSREMAAADRRENHLYVVDSMGLVSSIVLGLSLGLAGKSDQRVVGVEGDGGMLMNLNALATIGFLQPPNLLLIVLDNQSYASTGGQPTFTTELDLAGVARSCGFKTWQAADLEELKQSLAESARTPGPAFILGKIDAGNQQVPLLLDDPVVLGDRFNRWLAPHAGG